MNTFVSAIANQESRTLNDMKARKSTASACVDLFYKIGASRGKDIIPDFVAAYVNNPEVALRIAQWARDIRGGAGERQIYRDIMKYLETSGEWDALMAMMKNTAEIGRWDDLLIFSSEKAKSYAYNLIEVALLGGNGLCAKWMPRQGSIAAELRSFMGMAPRAYRKLLVRLTRVVETQMCAKQWDYISFSSVPSVASTRYKKAFNRNTPNYGEYVAKLASGDKDVKVNAGAVYPYDVIKEVLEYGRIERMTDTERQFIIAQWNALENFVGDAAILPMVDVSGSMYSASVNKTLTAMDIAVSLGLYLADKNTGAFNGTFLTFSGTPDLVTLNGDIVQKTEQMSKSKWGITTDLIQAMKLILSTALTGNVDQKDMPKMLVILSDMQFDECARFDDSAMEAIRRGFGECGYTVPAIVFWNLCSYDNVPVKYNENGVALVSGFSPSIMKSILECDMEKMTPEAIMLNTVMVDRYKLKYTT